MAAARADARRAERALISFRQEIEYNRAELDSALTSQRRLLQQLQTPNADISLDLPILRNTTWDLIQATGAADELDFDVLETITQIHEAQTIYREAQVVIGERLLLLSVDAPEDAETLPASFAPLLANLISLEVLLTEEYDAALTMLDER